MRVSLLSLLLIAACGQASPMPGDAGGGDAAANCSPACALGERCVDDGCEPGCDENADCGEGGVCDVENRECACSGTAHLCGGACYAFDDPSACGPGCDVCEAPGGASASCDGATCGYDCDPGNHLCDGACRPDDDAASCGARCTPCPGGDDGTPACDAGSCTLSCNPGFVLCGGRCVDTATDNEHCGGCGAPCNDDTICQANSCAPLPCPVDGVCPGRSWCDAASDICRPGCDRDEVCGASEVCDVSAHDCVCAPGTHRCGGACVPDISIDSCGDSCTPCAGVANGSATCDATSCGISCDPGFHSCDGACVADDSAGACGASCAVCPAPANGSATCVADVCSVGCDPGYHECNGVCHVDGMPDPCSCMPATCADLGADCGMIDDGCGMTLNCGGCAAGTCGGAGAPNVCAGAGGTGICVRPGWCWEHPLPADLDLDAVVALASDDVWVGGEEGVVMRWDGASWSYVDGVSYDVWHLSGTGPSNVWMSGLTGAARWNGTDWVDHSGGQADSGVFSLSPTAAWASIRDWSGATASMRSWNGTLWTDSAPSAASRCTAVIGTAANDVWAGCNGGHVRWNGSNWLLPVGGMRASDYDRASTGELFAVGNTVQTYNGVDWVAASLGSGVYSRLSVVSTNEIWFAGTQTNVLEATSTGDTTHTFARTALDVAAIASDDVWVVGDDYLLEHWDGTAWTGVRQDAFTDNLTAITDGTHGAQWAVGDNGLVVRFDGTRWVRVPNPSMENLNAVWSRDPARVWAIGENGTILGCESSGCVQIATTFGEDLYDVWGPSTSSVWAVGESGRIAFYDGTAWAAIPSPTATHLFAVHGTSASDVWIGGVWAIHWDGTNWRPHDIAGGAGVVYTSIYAAASDDVWFAMGSHWIDHWDGSNIWISRAPGAIGEDWPVRAVFGTGSRTFALVVPNDEPSRVYERVGTSWSSMGSMPYTFGGTLRHPAAVMADDSMRFLRARDNFRGSPAAWKNHAILYFDPVRAAAP